MIVHYFKTGRALFIVLCTLIAHTTLYMYAADTTQKPMGAHAASAEEELDIVAQPSAFGNAQSATLDDDDNDDEEGDQEIEDDTTPRYIRTISITGNKNVSDQAIITRVPFHIGAIFHKNKTATLIRSLYFDLKRFKQVTVKTRPVGTNQIDILIAVEEKPLLKEVVLQGNKNLPRKEIEKSINFENIPAVDANELERYALIIRRMYEHKGYFGTTVTPILELDELNKATAIFVIEEAPKSSIRHITFDGNMRYTGKQLRDVIFSKEDWLLSFMDGSGVYEPDRLEGDRQSLEQFYQNNGYIVARVTDITTDIDPQTGTVDIAFDINEGKLYTVKSVKAFGNDILSDEYLTRILPLQEGQPYSRELLIESIKTLEMAWGSLGYVFAHVEPSVESDDEAHTVSVIFHCEEGKPVFLNKLTIRGNKKTRDKVIRRNIPLEEGLLITKNGMELAKNRLEGLGYFEQRDGVTWKVIRLSDTEADLDMVLKETKTGSANIKIGFGGSASDMTTPGGGVSADFNISDTNWFGTGTKGSLIASIGTNNKSIALNISQPWLYDKPIYGSFDLYHNRVGYDQFTMTPAVNEKHTGASVVTGFMLNTKYPNLRDTYLRFGLTGEDIRYERQPFAVLSGFGLTAGQRAEAEANYNIILNLEFEKSSYASINAQAGQDTRNHPMHPSRGHTWVLQTQFAVPSFKDFSGFVKTDFEANWFTPLIGERDLVFKLHMYLGLTQALGRKLIPYRELFHIGGPASVRGFLFGQIGPQFAVMNDNGATRSDSIGGLKALFVNAELIFPITADFTMKGLVFYDGGAGWDNPHASCVPRKYIRNNTFNYRHAVGVGLRLLNPMPVRIDWGFKLDPQENESSHEVHFGMTYDW